MIKVMFWNIDRKVNFEQIIVDVINAEEIDILLLAEAENINDLLIEQGTTLFRKGSPLPVDENRLTPRFYSSNRDFSLAHYHTVPNTKRMVFTFLEIPRKPVILLGGLHFPSKLEYDPGTQSEIAHSYVNWLTSIEDNSKRTILFGDFNMNPYEIGMISPHTFNATLSKVIATGRERVFQGDSFDFFYNPMWNFMGDQEYDTGDHKLPGSYFFHTTGDANAPFWNVFDKVIVRPNAIEYLDLTSIRYLNNSGQHQFLNIDNAGRYAINKVHYSDHLPLLFNLNS